MKKLDTIPMYLLGELLEKETIKEKKKAVASSPKIHALGIMIAMLKGLIDEGETLKEMISTTDSNRECDPDAIALELGKYVVRLEKLLEAEMKKIFLGSS